MSGEAGHVELLERDDVDDEIQSAWRRLAVARENPFVSPEWYDAWRAPARERPLVLVWRRRRGGDVKGVLPLVLARSGGARVLRFAGARRADWLGPACERSDERDLAVACMAALRGRASAWDVLRLDRVEAADLWRSACREAWSGASCRAVGRPDVLPYVDLRDGFEGWLSSRSRNFRGQLGRRRRRAESEHELTFRETREGAGLAADLDLAFQLHDVRRRAQGGEGRLPEAAKRAHRRFAPLALERGWLRLHLLEVDGAPAAAWYGWRFGGRYGYLLSGFDPSYDRLGIGTLLLAHTIERAAAEGADTYDMLWGDEAYKSRFETGRRRVDTLLIAGGTRGRAVVGGERLAAGARHRLPEPLRKRLRRARSRMARR